VISPESCAAIIYRDSGKAEQAAAALRLTAEDLSSLGLIDGIVPSPAMARTKTGMAPPNCCASPWWFIWKISAGLTPEQIVDHRYEKFRKMGNFFA